VIWGAKMPVENTADVRSLGRQFAACDEAIEWAASECRDAREIWEKADAEKVVWIATRSGVLTDEQLMEFVEEALGVTPPPNDGQLARIRACLDGSDRMTYSEGCSRALWAALALVCWGRFPDGDKDVTRLVQAAILRRVCPQPFSGGPGR